MGPGPSGLDRGRLSGARDGAEAQGSARWVRLKASEGSPESASEATQHPFAAQSLGPAPACGDPEQ